MHFAIRRELADREIEIGALPQYRFETFALQTIRTSRAVMTAKNDLLEATRAIEALGAVANDFGSLGAIKPVCQWLDWPDWLRNHTRIEGGGELPARVSWRDKIFIYHNILENADMHYLVGRAVHTPDILVQPAYHMAFRTSPTLNDSLEILTAAVNRYNPHLSMERSESGDLVRYEIVERIPLGRIMDLAGLLGVMIVYGAISSNPSKCIEATTISLSGSGRAYDQARDALLCKVALGQAINHVELPAETLSAPNPNVDLSTWNLAKNRIQMGLSVDGDGAVATRVRSYIAQCIQAQGRVPKLEEIAALDGVSARTLHNKLSENHVGFQHLVHQERQRLALEWIADTESSLGDIAHRLGFANSATFSRAFRTWFGKAPSEHRKG